MPDMTPPRTGAPAPASGAIAAGSRVRVRDTDGEHQYTIVTSIGHDALSGRVSVGSPVGRALLGRRRGEQVRVRTPGGVRLLTIVEITAPEHPSPDGPLPCGE